MAVRLNFHQERSSAAGAAMPLFKHFPSPVYLTLHQSQQPDFYIPITSTTGRWLSSAALRQFKSS
jgi:hypothetical protein